MENWQKEHIKENLSKLVEETSCETGLLPRLALFISNGEKSLLEARLGSNGREKQSELLYEIAVKKTGMYKALTNALLETLQTGPFIILLKGALKHRPDSVLDEVSPLIQKILEKVLLELKEDVLQCLVKNQGHAISLQETLQSLGKDVKQRLIEKYLDGKLLVELVCNKQPVLINKSAIPKSFPYYISRRLTTRHYLDPAIFNHRCNDVFVVKRVQLNDLCNLAKNQDIDLSGNQLESLTVRFIVLEYEEEYEEICNLSPDQPVHLIDYIRLSDRFVLIRTSGDISNVQKFVNESQDELSEENFLQSCLLSSQPVCISDTPGMGKTALLTNLANRILQKHPRHLLRFIVLREFVPIVQERGKGNIDKELLIDIISEQSSDFEFGRDIVRELLHSEEKVVVLMFDGFDEVLFNQMESAKSVLRILSDLKAVRLYVATRPHMRDELEQCLGTLGYNIVAFQRSEQVDCLTKYWEKQGACEGSDLDSFANLCLESLENNMNDSERSIAGIPLQCKMLAEVYERDAIKYSKPQSRVCNFDTGVVFQITSIFDMYQKLVDLKFKGTDTIGDGICSKKWITFAHIYAAVQLLFPEFDAKLKDILVLSDHEIELCSFGILEKKKSNVSTPRFFHRTLAEFFMGMFFVRMLLYHEDFGVQEYRKDLLDFFYNNVLHTNEMKELPLSSCKLQKVEPAKSATFQHQVICYFVNAYLKIYRGSNSGKSPWTNDAARVYDVLAACIVHDYPNLFRLTSEEPKTYPYLLLSFTELEQLSLLSAKHSSKELFKEVYENMMQYAKEKPFVAGLDSSEFLITPLHVAAERGHFFIVKFLLDSYCAYVLQSHEFVVHCCVAGSIHDSASTIACKIEIINMIKVKRPDWINESMPNGSTPLLQSGVNVKLIQELLLAGANVNATNGEGCVLHTLVGNEIIPENFSELVINLRYFHGFVNFNTIDKKQRTSLHSVIEKVELTDEAIQLFQEMNADVNAVDELGNSILFYAIRGHRSIDVLKCLLSLGAKLEQQNLNEENIFHVCARYGNHEAYQYFLELQLLDKSMITALNRKGVTPFTLAFERGKGIPINIIKLLEQNGFEITEEVASAALKAFICNKYIMAWELGDSFVVVADYLVGKGGIVKFKGGKTPWELEATRRNLPTILQTIKPSDLLQLDMEKRGFVGVITQTNEEKPNSPFQYKDGMSLTSKFKKREVYHTHRSTTLSLSNSFFSAIQGVRNSFENLCASLIHCKQIRPFMLLKQCLQSDMQDAPKFLSPPSGLVQFIESKKEQLLLLQSWDTRLSLTRIRNKIDSDACLITDELLDSIQQNEHLVVYECENVTERELQIATSFKRKTICLVDINSTIVCDSKKYQLLKDELSWIDLAGDFQEKLLLPHRARNKAKGIVDEETYLQLKNQDLIQFIHKQENCMSELDIILEEYRQEFKKTRPSISPQLSGLPDFLETPLHIAIHVGHWSIVEYLLNSVSYPDLQSLKYLVHHCVLETSNDTDVTEKIRILELLCSVNKHWINEYLPNGSPPLLLPNIHEKLVSCLIKCGADISVAVLCGKKISLIVIRILEKDKISITPEVASKILQDLFCNSNLNEWDLKTDFIRVCDYFIGKRGVIRCRNDKNPWELELIQKNIHYISKATKCSDDLLEEVKRRGIFLQDDIESAEKFYSKIMSSHKLSFEKICLSLLSCHQIIPFNAMRLCLDVDVHHKNVFVTTPKGLPDFFAAEEKVIFVLRSFDTGLTIMRLKDTVDPNLVVISKCEEIEELSRIKLIVYMCDHISEIEYLAAFGRKIICLCTGFEENMGDSLTIKEEELSWEDLSPDFQHDLLDCQECEVGRKIAQLKNEELVKFLGEHRSKFMGFENDQIINKDDYLSLNIFQYFLPDKLVIVGITRIELNQFVKFGQIGEIGDDVSNLDYIVLNDVQPFENICKQLGSTIHLIKHEEGTFKLIKTRGSDKNIKSFINEKPNQQQCDNFPVCTCRKHEVGSENLIWNVPRYPGEMQTDWINVLDLIKCNKSKNSFRFGIPSVITTATIILNGMVSLECGRQKVRRFLDNRIIHSAEVIVELLKYVECEENELMELQQVAAKTLFPKTVKTIQVSTPTIDKYVQFGILKCSSDSVVFVHKVFAWYFVSEMLIKEQPSQLVLELRQEIFDYCFEDKNVEVNIRRIKPEYNWANKIIKTFQFVQATFFRFLDRLVGLNPNLVSSWIDVRKTNDFLTKWLHACILGNHFHLLNVFLSLGVEQEIFKSEDLVTLAVMYADVPIIQLLTEKFELSANTKIFDIRLYEDISSKKQDISVLHVAARRGSFVVMDFLLNTKGFKLKLNQPIMSNLVAFCVEDTNKDPGQVEDRKRMISAVLENDETSINERNTTQNSPFMFNNIHLDLVLYLLSLGVNVPPFSRFKRNILQFSPEYMTPEEYHQLIQTLVVKGNSQIFLARDRFKRTLLHYAVKHLEVLDSTLQLFSAENADFNAKARNGNTALICAVLEKRSLRLLESLSNCGADFHQLGEQNMTVLHFAAKSDNFSALRYFISRRCDVNAKDRFKKTPLHHALRFHGIVELLVKHGADVNAINGAGETPLSLALDRTDEVENRTVLLLRNAGAHE